MKLEFSRQIFEKNTEISNFMKIRPVEAELFHADGRTDMTKPMVAFPQFCELGCSVTDICLTDFLPIKN